ncbi:hypothetical protein Tco_1052982 [Tanacetum coccineum]
MPEPCSEPVLVPALSLSYCPTVLVPARLSYCPAVPALSPCLALRSESAPHPRTTLSSALQECSYSCTSATKRKTTWFDLLLKSDIDKNENHILGPSTVAIAKKLKAIIQKDELTIADLKGAGLETLKYQYHNDVELEYHVSQLKATMLTESKWNNDEDDVSKPRSYYKQGIEDMIPDRWCKETHRYIFEALNGIHYWDGDKIYFFKAKMSTRTEGSVYSYLRIKLVVRVVVKKKWGYVFLTSIVVRRSDDKEYEFSYAYLYRLRLNDVEDIRVVIQNKVEDIQLGVESYQQTLNLTKPMMFFEGIDQKIPFIMSGTHKGVVYLNQHNIKSFMKLSEVKKFYDGTLLKVRENLVDMVKRNKLGTGKND